MLNALNFSENTHNSVVKFQKFFGELIDVSQDPRVKLMDS